MGDWSVHRPQHTLIGQTLGTLFKREIDKHIIIRSKRVNGTKTGTVGTLSCIIDGRVQRKRVLIVAVVDRLNDTTIAARIHSQRIETRLGYTQTYKSQSIDTWDNVLVVHHDGGFVHSMSQTSLTICVRCAA
jgi:hypothetical protein